MWALGPLICLRTTRGAAIRFHAQLLQNHFQWAKLGKTALEKVCPYESGEPEPVLTLEHGAFRKAKAK
jgi:hypothetical protein